MARRMADLRSSRVVWSAIRPQSYLGRPLFSTHPSGVLSKRACDEHVVIASSAHRAARQQAARELGGALGAAPPERDERPPVGARPLDRKDRARVGVNVYDVIVLAPVLVDPLERPPAGGEREAAVPAGEIAEIGHTP